MERRQIFILKLFWRLGLPWLVVPLAFGVVFMAVSWSDWQDQKALARDGIVGEAVILHREVSERRNEDGDVTRSYHMTYRFRPEGDSTMIESRATVPRALYDSTRVGSYLPVTYVWHRPEISTLTPTRSLVGPLVFGLIGAGLSLGAAVGLAWAWARLASALRAARRGEMREARVTAISPAKLRVNGGKRYHLSWVDAAGALGQSLPAPSDLALARDVGDVIVVYIDPKNGRAWWQKQL